MLFFFFKQKTAYEMRISDWSSDVCSSDLDLWAPRERGDLRRRLEPDLRAGRLRARLLHPGAGHRGALQGERLLRARGRAGPAVERPGARHRLACGRRCRAVRARPRLAGAKGFKIGSASCRGSGCESVKNWVVAET